MQPSDPSLADAPDVPVCALSRRGFVGAAAGLVLVGCGPGNKWKTKAVAAKDGTVELALKDFPELATPGGMAAVVPAGMRKPVIVMRLEGDQFRVMSSRCPHLGCVVRWDNGKQLLVCPCHGSEFTDDGKVTKGPAKQGLEIYPSELWGAKLRFSVRES